MSDQCPVIDADPGEQGRHNGRLVLWPKAETVRSLRQAEAGEIDRDAAIVRSKSADHMAIKERPGRVTMDHEKGRALPFVHIVNIRPTCRAKMTLEREGTWLETECPLCMAH